MDAKAITDWQKYGNGFMLVGPALCGKFEIMTILTVCMPENGKE